ncbi:MAG: hypothetical protein K1X94_13595 [Sandaracinaceae bacterium]|nr:hypothetical protein [Sandaracinaceae bacterium]
MRALERALLERALPERALAHALRGGAASLVLLLCLTACSASAQPRPSGAPRGLALERVLAETGLALDELVVPTDPRAAVRLELRDDAGLAALVDVRVLASTREAEARLAELEPSLSSRGVGAAPNVADHAFVDDARSIVALSRGNVLVVIRALSRAQTGPDVLALAAAIVRAADASPFLGTEGAALHLSSSVVPALQPGAASTVSLPEGFVALRVDVEGTGLARRLDDRSWIVEGATQREDVHVTAVDALLRVAR